MTAAEFVQEMERRGKWEVEVAFEVEDADEAQVGVEWRVQTVESVRYDEFDTEDGGCFGLAFTSSWRFPEKPRPDFLTWMRERRRALGIACHGTGGGSPAHNQYLGVKFAIDDYEAGRDP